MDDLLIRGGHLIDGSGGPGRDADVAVREGRIAAIEPRSARPAHRVIDARGQVVAPGFIDIHTHSDFTLPLNPRAESKIRQGVTLEVVGNCGFSVAPALPGKAAMLREYLASSATWLPFHETTFADYAAGFPPTSVNVILQVGHNTLRLMTAGLENRPLTADEMAAMERLLEEALAARRLGALVRPVHRARQLRGRRRDPRARARAPAPPRRLLDAHARRGRPGLRGRAGGDRRRRGHRRPRPDRAPEALGRRQLGRGRPAARRDRRPRAAAGFPSTATPIPMTPPPTRCATCSPAG